MIQFLRKVDVGLTLYFQGRSTPDWNYKAQAVFSNISLATKRQDILKGILEGVFIEINNNIQRLKKYVDIKHIYVSGGLTKSSLINQILLNTML